MSKHTRIPWEVSEELDGVYSGSKTWIKGARGFIAKTTNQVRPCLKKEECEANAHFIVTACNCHDELVGACKDAKSALTKFALPNYSGIQVQITELAQLIAKAKGED